MVTFVPFLFLAATTWLHGAECNAVSACARDAPSNKAAVDACDAKNKRARGTVVILIALNMSTRRYRCCVLYSPRRRLKARRQREAIRIQHSCLTRAQAGGRTMSRQQNSKHVWPQRSAFRVLRGAEELTYNIFHISQHIGLTCSDISTN